MTRRRAIALAFCLPVAGAVLFLFLATPSFQATTVVTLAPSEGPGESTLPIEQRPATVAAEVAAALSPELQRSLDEFLAFEHGYAVVADESAATLTITTTAGSAEEALTAAEIASALFVGRRTELPDAAGAPGSAVSAPATLPDEPVTPQFVQLLAASVAAGVVLAGIVAAVTLRHAGRAPERGRREGDAGTPAPEPRRHRPTAAQAGMTAVLLIGSAGVVVGAFAGLHELWEVRTTTDHQVEASIACIPRWLDEVPDGASIYPQPDPPEIRSDFWLARLTELAFPRLDVATTPAAADYQVKIVLVGEGGRLPCAGYEAIITPR